MTRAEDSRAGAALGAAYVGVIFAGGPRALTPARAAEVLAAAPAVHRVGVFGAATPPEIVDTARSLELDVVQLHGSPAPSAVEKVRFGFAGAVWAVLRLEDGSLPGDAAALFEIADAVVLDAKVPGALGGTGVPLPWSDLAPRLEPLRGTAKLVVAGGLRPDNVATAIRLLRPDVVDVSSGVETAPGIKDPARMRAFRDAVRGSE